MVLRTLRVITKLIRITSGSLQSVAKQCFKDMYRDGVKAIKSINFGNKMTLGEANKILGIEFGKKYTVEDIQMITRRMLELNEASGKYGGSPYIQEKLIVAEKLILDQIINNPKI
ncbi:mitochondria-associated granulocyte macrophage CSF signaling molecule [Cryptosporidium sp. chipmunk genotype I]|uniref:mitochondria-associated granulocyte macrophage CSF signaling molecule n=1 Tax=Cryptosporidium sp. chipmunk genotype I TaxID=1280935 RepID=UPI00351A9887|nr:mitochondria-associated granulocyte macrophage CSF signaling molecule [Cryptosporidium sp. chipmunk genotype I]